MNTKKLQKLADFLRTLSERQFDFNEVVADFDDDFECGTVCCAIGWTPVIFPDEVAWEDGPVGDKDVKYIANGYLGFDYVAARLFDCSAEEMSNLFMPEYQHNIDGWGNFPVCGIGATPNEVADAIEHYIEIRS